MSSTAAVSAITDFGAIGDGKSLCTQAIADTIDACSMKGGGTVYIPAGTFLTGPIHLKSNITLQLDAGAVVLFSDDMNLYPPVPTRWEGIECYGYSPLVYGYKLENVSIVGRGILDGQGKVWWEERRRRGREKVGQPLFDRDKELAALNPGYLHAGGGGGGRESQFLRPPLIQLMHCTNVLIQDVTCRNSPFWNTHIVYSEKVRITGVIFYNPSNTPNGDGCDIDSCKGVIISDCIFDVGDDCLCLKSGCDDDGRRVGRVCEDIVVTNCTMLRGHGGVVFGSEGAAGIRNVVVTNCIFRGTDRGIRLKTRRGRGGTTEDIRISNIIMQNVNCPFVMNMMYVCGVPDSERDAYFAQRENPVDEKTPCFRNISFSDITARNTSAAAAVISGLPEMPISGVTFDNIVIIMDPAAKETSPAMAYGIGKMKGGGFLVRDVFDFAMRNVTIENTVGTVVSLRDASDCDITGLRAKPLSAETIIELRDTSDITVRNCTAAKGVATLVRAGNDSKRLAVEGNNLRDADAIADATKEPACTPVPVSA